MKTTRPGSWLTPLLVLSLICSFALTATAQNYYPAEVGNTWVFLSADGAEQRTYTLEGPEDIDGEELILFKITNDTLGTDASVIDKYFITVDSAGGLILHQSAVDQGAFGIAEATYDPPVIFFPADLPLGHIWEIVTETELKLVGAATSTSTIEVVAIENVETPIGVFEGLCQVGDQSSSRHGTFNDSFDLLPMVGTRCRSCQIHKRPRYLVRIAKLQLSRIPGGGGSPHRRGTHR